MDHRFLECLSVCVISKFLLLSSIRNSVSQRVFVLSFSLAIVPKRVVVWRRPGAAPFSVPGLCESVVGVGLVWAVCRRGSPSLQELALVL